MGHPLSPASYWEIAIKVSLGKLQLSAPFESVIPRAILENDFISLPILPAHAAVLSSLPFHHRDPFDRMLIAQALAEDMPVIGTDVMFDQYPIRRIW